MMKFLKSPAGIVCEILIIIIFTLMQINSFIYGTTYENYIIGIVTGFIELIITVSFVQYVFDNKKMNDEKQNELERISRLNIILSLYIENYTIYYNKISTPMGNERGKVSSKVFKKDFKLSDMYDLYKPSLLMRDEMYKSVIEMFYVMEKNIREIMIQILINQEFKYYVCIRDLFLGFIDISIKYDSSEAVISYKNLNMRSNLDISKFLKEDADDLFEKFKEGNLENGNLVHPFIMLYYAMLFEANILEQYNNFIKSMK